mgnify:CR=1 FL=1
MGEENVLVAPEAAEEKRMAGTTAELHLTARDARALTARTRDSIFTRRAGDRQHKHDSAVELQNAKWAK